MLMLARRHRAPQLPREDLEERINRAYRALLAARDWDERAARWADMRILLSQRPPEVVARLERERLARVTGEKLR
jgi:hypothetical protein